MEDEEQQDLLKSTPGVCGTTDWYLRPHLPEQASSGYDPLPTKSKSASYRGFLSSIIFSQGPDAMSAPSLKQFIHMLGYIL